MTLPSNAQASLLSLKLLNQVASPTTSCELALCRRGRAASPAAGRRGLAQDWFGEGLLETRCCLDGKRTGDLLRILEDVEVSDLAPAQGNHVNGVLEIPAVVQQCRSPIPLHEHHCVPWRAFHPDVLDLEMEIGQDSRQALEPQAQSLLVVTLTTNRVDPAETVMDSWADGGHQLVPTMVVDVVEGQADSLLDDRAVKHEFSLQIARTLLKVALRSHGRVR